MRFSDCPHLIEQIAFRENARRDYNRWQTKRRRSSDAVGSPCAQEWYTHLLLRDHVFHRLRTNVQQLGPWRSK